MSELRGHGDEPDVSKLGGFHVRWYTHRQGRQVGPFQSTDEVTIYMARLGLPRPDELLMPVDV